MESFNRSWQYILFELFLNIINTSNVQQKYATQCNGLGISKS